MSAMEDWRIREERAEDIEPIAELNRVAFQGGEEAELIARLRDDGMILVSLVALGDERLLGHILFSKLGLRMEHGTVPAVALAPMAVDPEWQRRGIGSHLIREGHRICRERGASVSIVLGHPDYYPRFGYSAELAWRLKAPFSGEAFMAFELESGVLGGASGEVTYPAAFGLGS